VIYWFNPLLYLYRNAIRLNHEFLADDAVLLQNNDIRSYQNLLLDKLSVSNNIRLCSSFHYSVTKKRFYMMLHNTSRRKAMLKLALLIPVLPVLTLLMNTNVRAQARQQPEKVREKEQRPPLIIDNIQLDAEIPSTREGASKEMLDEYKALEEKYRDQNAGSDPRRSAIKWKEISPEDKRRMETIYKKMSRAQRKTVNIGFIPPPKPMPKNIPTQEQLTKWATAGDDVYGIWVNDKRIRNSDLTKYTASDFSLYDASKLSEKAVANDGFKVQLELMTNAFYEKYVKETLARKDYILFVRMTGPRQGK
jgi:hypothetical protein